jgi:hypothetical protein
MKLTALTCLALVSTLAPIARASEAGGEEPNPLTQRMSLPFESTFQFGVGPNEDLRYTLKIKSVFPMPLGRDWHLFHRPIVEILAQPEPKPGEAGAFGLGDLEYQLYVSPPSTKDFIWGLGPDLWFPTATATALGTGKASAGVAGAFHLVIDPWTLGAIVTQHWSYAGDPDRSSVSELTVQPHVVFHLPDGWYLVSSPILKANWKAASGQVWTIPVGGGGGKEFDLAAGEKVNVQLQGLYNVARPDFHGRWELRLTLQWLFPRGA